MYKASYAAGDTWYEFIKMGPKDFREYKIEGDGSHHVILTGTSLKTVRDTTRMDNHLYATKGGLLKLARTTDGEQFLTKEDLAKYAPSAIGMTRMQAVALSDSIPF